MARDTEMEMQFEARKCKRTAMELRTIALELNDNAKRKFLLDLANEYDSFATALEKAGRGVSTLH